MVTDSCARLEARQLVTPCEVVHTRTPYCAPWSLATVVAGVV
jgi:hypothetical protein